MDFLRVEDFPEEDRKNFEEVTGLDFSEVLMRMQGETKKKIHFPDQSEIFEYLLEMMENPIQGAHQTSLGVLFIRDLMTPEDIEEEYLTRGTERRKGFILRMLKEGKAVIIFLVGEVHTNPGTCVEENLRQSKDIILDILIPLLINVGTTVLIFESFFHLLKSTIEEMQHLFGRMQRNNFAFSHVTECKESDVSCIYKDDSSALQFLRMFKVILHYLSLLCEKNVPHMDPHICNLNARVYNMDPREDLKMANPFLKNPPSDERMVESARSFIEGIGKYGIGGGMESSPVWKKAFDDGVFFQVGALAERIIQSPNLKDYTELFLWAPDVLSVMYTMVVIEESIVKNQVRPIVMGHGGDTHRKNLIKGLTRADEVFIVDIYRTNMSEGMESCALPQRKEKKQN